MATQNLTQNPPARNGQPLNEKTTKYCPRCKIEKPLTIENFSINRSEKDGFCFYCHECRQELDRAYNNSEKGKATRQTYRQSERAITLRQVSARSEKRKAARVAYQQSEEYKARRAAWIRGEKSRSWRKAYRKTEVYKAWLKSERGNLLAKVRDANKHAKRFGAPGRLTVQDAADLFSMYEACLCCGSPDNLTIDHIIALSRGGDNTPDNIQVLCRHCNNKKGTKTSDYRERYEQLDGIIGLAMREVMR